MTSRPHPVRPTGRLGFTLIEMVLSLAVMAILLVAMASAVTVASRAVPDPDGSSAAVATNAAGLQRFRDDLHAAVELTERTDTSVTLVLPDRTGDGLPEVVRYAWSGTAGDPLTRAFNHGDPVDITTAMDDITLTYVTTDHEVVFTGVPVESGEMVLSSYVDPVWASGSSPTSFYKVTLTNWLGYRLSPTLDPDVVAWYPTRAQFRAKKQSSVSMGTLALEVKDWDESAPGDTVYDQGTLSVASFANNAYLWEEVALSGETRFTPGQTLAVTHRLEGVVLGSAQVSTNTSATPANYFSTSNSGSSWVDNTATGRVEHYVYGKQITLASNWKFTRQRVSYVTLSVDLTMNGLADQQVVVSLSNAPDVLDALWATDFAASPETLDLDDDGTADWGGTASGLAAGTVSDGAWSLRRGVTILPDDVDLDDPFTLDLSMRDDLDNDMSGGVILRFDRDASSQAMLMVSVQLDDEVQTLSVVSVLADGTGEVKSTAYFEEGDWATLRLTVDTTGDRVHVAADGVALGSFAYETVASDDEPSLEFEADASGAVLVDSVALRLGGDTADTTEQATGLVEGVGNQIAGATMYGVNQSIESNGVSVEVTVGALSLSVLDGLLGDDSWVEDALP